MSDLIPAADHPTEQPVPSKDSRWFTPRGVVMAIGALLLGLVMSPFTPVMRPATPPAGMVAAYVPPGTLIYKPIAAADNVIVTYYERIGNKGELLEDKPPTVTYRGDAVVDTFCTAFEQLDAGDSDSSSWGPNYTVLQSDCAIAAQQVSTDAAACEQTLMGMARATGLDLGSNSFDFVTTRALDTACDDSNLAAAINAGAADVPVFSVSQGKDGSWLGDRPIMK